MSNMIFAIGEQIYQAAIEGAKCGYNRSTDNYKNYEQMISQQYETILRTLCNREERRTIQKQTCNNWKKAFLPLSLALVHKHIGGQPSEAHARVYLSSHPASVFDIPMVRWINMEKIYDERCAGHNLRGV